MKCCGCWPFGKSSRVVTEVVRPSVAEGGGDPISSARAVSAVGSSSRSMNPDVPGRALRVPVPVPVLALRDPFAVGTASSGMSHRLVPGSARRQTPPVSPRSSARSSAREGMFAPREYEADSDSARSDDATLGEATLPGAVEVPVRRQFTSEERAQVLRSKGRMHVRADLSSSDDEQDEIVDVSFSRRAHKGDGAVAVAGLTRDPKQRSLALLEMGSEPAIVEFLAKSIGVVRLSGTELVYSRLNEFDTRIKVQNNFLGDFRFISIAK